MTKDENNLFHANYKYMWNKLSTTYYHVKTGTPKASHIQGGAYLPAYSICSKYFKTDYEPSIGTVDSIVQFYNQNLSPQINTYQFLHEKLEKTDEIRYQTKTINDQRFIGKYYGYYLSTSGENLGAVLQVYEDNDILKAVIITGIRNNEELFGNELADIFSNTPPTSKHFQTYFETRSTENQRCSFYEGTVDITTSSILIFLTSPIEPIRKMVITFNIDCFPPGYNRPYHGGLSFVMATSDGPFDTRVFKMGFINQITKANISLNDKGIRPIVKIYPHENYQLSLTSSEDRQWYELIMKHTHNPPASKNEFF